MNRLRFLQSAAGMGVYGLSAATVHTDFSVENYVEIWKISKELTLEYAEAMPQADYLFRPAGLDDVYTYGGQMQHIAQNKINLLSRYITELEPPDITLDREDNKTAIKLNISRSFDYGTHALRSMNRGEWMEDVEFSATMIPRWQVLFVAQDHTTHHCGQAVVYLNAKGIQPPYYRKW